MAVSHQFAGHPNSISMGNFVTWCLIAENVFSALTSLCLIQRLNISKKGTNLPPSLHLQMSK